MENRLIDFSEGSIDLTLVILRTLLIDGPLHLINHSANNITTVFQPDGHATGVRLRRQESQKINRVSLRQPKPIFVAVRINIIRVNTIAALLLRHIQPRAHDRANAARLDIEPAFALPFIEVAAEVCSVKFASVWAPVFVRARREVADDFVAFALKSRDCLGGVVEEVDVPDVGVDGGVFDGVNELNLPFDSGCRLPDGVVGGSGIAFEVLLLVVSSSELSLEVHSDGEEEEPQNTGYYHLSLGR